MTHAKADVPLAQEVQEKTANVPLTPAAKRTGFAEILKNLAERAQPQLPPGPVLPPVSPGGIDGGVVGVLGGRDYNRPLPQPQHKLSLQKAGNLFHRAFNSIAELFSMKTEIPGAETVVAPTHMLGLKEAELKFYPYDDLKGTKQGELTKILEPGEVGIFIKHHSPKPDADEKEQMKLQCTHIGLMCGVKNEDGSNGVITINNPPGYQQGLFGAPDYPGILVKVKFPEGVSKEQKLQYMENMQTWLALLNTYTKFPPDYNGGDPLGTRSVSQCKDLGNRVISALLGNEADRAWLQKDENMVYCAELAHLALNLAIHYPLNKGQLGDRFDGVKAKLTAGDFLQGHQNQYIGQLTRKMAPETLKPILEIVRREATEPDENRAFGDGLAIRPFTISDMVEEFIRATLPREKLGEHLADEQKMVLEKAWPGILEATGIGALPPEHPAQAQVAQLKAGLLQVIGTEHESYAAFRGALKPLMMAARKITNPRGDGTGAFIPPHAYLVRATESMTGKPVDGVVGFEYAGHIMHQSALEPAA